MPGHLRISLQVCRAAHRVSAGRPLPFGRYLRSHLWLLGNSRTFRRPAREPPAQVQLTVASFRFGSKPAATAAGLGYHFSDTMLRTAAREALLAASQDSISVRCQTMTRSVSSVGEGKSPARRSLQNVGLLILSSLQTSPTRKSCGTSRGRAGSIRRTVLTVTSLALVRALCGRASARCRIEASLRRNASGETCPSGSSETASSGGRRPRAGLQPSSFAGRDA